MEYYCTESSGKAKDVLPGILVHIRKYVKEKRKTFCVVRDTTSLGTFHFF